MKKHLTFSNLLFVVALFLLIYSPTREWILRQVAFAPSVIKEEGAEKINSYQWKLQGLNNQNIDFQNLKGKVVLINFWATWCPPCRAEMPMLHELYKDYGDKIAFVLVTNENWEKVKPFFKENNYRFPVYNSLNNPPSLFTKNNSIPATYLIDKKGYVRISKTGAANWNSNKIRKLIDKLLQDNYNN